MIQKRGIAAGQLVMIMITLVAFVLIAGTIMRFQSKVEGTEAELVCHNSLQLKAKTKVDVGPVEGSTPALCKTSDYKFSASTKEQAMEYVSKRMERCWWIWLEGQYSEFFGGRGLFGSDDATKCFICSTVAYEEGPAFSKTELRSEISEIKSKYRGGGSILSYVQENGYVEVMEEQFTAGEIYAVVFASNIEESFWTSSFGRVLGFYPPYNQNGLWLVSLNRLEKQQPCYYEPDIAGN